VQNPVSVPDLFATVASALGMNPAKSLMTPVGRPIAITEQGTPVAALLA
jgi:arylsulfatase A-like enzyme